MTKEPAAFDARSIERPDPKLWTYYIIVSLMTLVAAPIMLVALYIRYHTLRYRFDDEGLAMSVGFLFKREVYLTYRRIQDIHVSRGIIQRYLGLATISLQTASGSSTAEMQIEGVLQPDELRDWIYARMRGSALAPSHEASGVPGRVAAAIATSAGAMAQVASHSAHSANVGAGRGADGAAVDGDDATVVLEQILHEVRALRERLEHRP